MLVVCFIFAANSGNNTCSFDISSDSIVMHRCSCMHAASFPGESSPRAAQLPKNGQLPHHPPRGRQRGLRSEDAGLPTARRAAHAGCQKREGRFPARLHLLGCERCELQTYCFRHRFFVGLTVALPVCVCVCARVCVCVCVCVIHC